MTAVNVPAKKGPQKNDKGKRTRESTGLLMCALYLCRLCTSSYDAKKSASCPVGQTKKVTVMGAKFSLFSLSAPVRWF